MNCNHIEIILASDVISIIQNEIVLKKNCSFQPHTPDKLSKFKQTQTKNIFNQEISFESIFENVPTIANSFDNYINKHLIVKVFTTDNDYFVWGSLKPYNPVELKLTAEGNSTQISFTRKSHILQK